MSKLRVEIGRAASRAAFGNLAKLSASYGSDGTQRTTSPVSLAGGVKVEFGAG
jgi:hypothetical protein